MLSIGQFSKVCMVTVKTLRHYDKIGLLTPKSINPENGYRFYSEEQIPRMLLINRLKLYGFSLTDIKEFLCESDSDILINRLKKQKEMLVKKAEDSLIIANELECHIESMERTGNIMSYQNNYEVKLENTEDVYIISNRQNMNVDDFGKYYGLLYKRVADEKLVLDGRCIALYHDKEFNPEHSDIELALGVQDKSCADRKIAGGLCACVTHYGSYSKLSEAYGAVTKWISENGYETENAPYEIYIKTHFDKIPVEQWETRIFFPVKKA